MDWREEITKRAIEHFQNPAHSEHLTDWEKSFVSSMLTNHSYKIPAGVKIELSRKQFARLNEIYNKSKGM
jgi:hypothetical protein